MTNAPTCSASSSGTTRCPTILRAPRPSTPRSSAGRCAQHHERPALHDPEGGRDDGRRPDADSRGRGQMGARPAWMGYIAVDDVKAYADKVKAAGGAIHREPTEIPNVGTFAVASDPHGAGFLLFKGNSGEAPEPTRPSPATSAGTSCTAAIRKARSPSTPACSAGRRARRWIWAPWASTRSSPPRASRAAA